jgi:hypothetical protein
LGESFSGEARKDVWDIPEFSAEFWYYLATILSILNYALLMNWQRILAVPLLIGLIVYLWRFPVGQIWLAGGGALYSILIARYPRCWLIVVPAAMPALDLAFFSGWFFFDEFDALVVLTLAILLWRCPLSREDFRFGRPLSGVIALLSVSFAVSLVIPLIPWPILDGNSLASYYSPLNALRVAKGFLWPLLLLPHLNQAVREYPGTAKLLAFGMVLGLFAMAVIALFEHWLFVGLFNFGHEYRISGPFSSMHTGDGHIDLWLATTIPLIFAIFVDRWPVLLRVGAAGVGCLSLYILLATASRGPFLATTVAFLVLICAFVLVWASRGNYLRTVMLVPTLIVLGGIVAVPFVMHTELGARFKLTGRDAQIRFDHFREALEFREPGTLTQIFGMGLGTFPATYRERRAHFHTLARYSFDGPPEQRYLTLSSGDNLYVSQKIEAKPNTPYLFSFDYRTDEVKSSLTAAICEKWLLHSRNCSWHSFGLKATNGTWRNFTTQINTNNVGMALGRLGPLSIRPIRMALFTQNAPGGLSVDNVALITADGTNLIRNSDFGRNNDHWFWTVDNHLPWHTKNMAVNVLFDQGWLGVSGVLLLILLTLAGLLRAVFRGRSDAVPWLAAMAGYLINGFVVSPFDQPRLAMLFFLICFFVILKYWHRSDPIVSPD